MRRFISFFIAAVMVAAIMTVSAYSSSNILGDANGDGVLDNRDVAALFYYSTGFTDGIDVSKCDVNGDGRVNNKDVVKVFQAVSGEIVIEYGTLSGKICKASSRTSPIPGASIKIFKGGLLYWTQTADSNGNYSIELPAGEFFIEITAEGYLKFNSYATVTANANTYMETFLMIVGTEEMTGTASGQIVNSLTGSGMDNVTLKVRKDWNNTNNAAETVASATTDSNGYYSFTLPLGNYTVAAEKEGCMTSTFNIIVQQGSTPNQNGTITPEISGDSYLITLTWGANPSDLDSHLVGRLSNGDQFHVYYSYKSQYDNGTEVCNLDYDDTTSYGPEHITLKVTADTPYYYYIHRYSGSGSIASSGAKVVVHQGNSLVAEINVPTDLGSSDYWNVFAIKEGRLILRNTMTSSPEKSYAN